MNTRKKKIILVVTGGRADYGLLRPVMREIQKSKTLTLRVLATGMHTLHSHGYSLDLVRRDAMPIATVVPIAPQDSMLDALAKEIKGIGDYCTKHRPDLIVVLGDRDEPFAAAIVGGHLGVPVAHLNGGDKTGDVVDEYIRHAITKFSHLHFPISHASARRVALLGEEKSRIFQTGGSGLDELRALPLPTAAVVAQRYNLSLQKPWFFVMHHPASLGTTGYKAQIAPMLASVARLEGEKMLIYPNADTGSKEFITEIDKYKHRPDFHIYKNIPRADLIAILKRCTLLIGNSSMGIIDASFLRVPTVNVGTRQAGRERGGNVLDCGYDATSVNRAINKALSPAFRKKVAKSKSPYGGGRAAPRIVRAIEENIGRKDLFRKKLTYV